MFQSMIKKIFVCAALVPTLACSQGTIPIFADSGRLERIKNTLPLVDSMYQEYAKKNHFPGYAFGIMVDGQLVYVGKGGYADVEKKTPVTAHTMFRIASMTKSFTALAILKLRDEGKLKLDDPVRLYIPEIGQQKLTLDSPEITIRDLLTHSSGFPEDNPWGDRNLSKTNEELTTLIKKGISFSNATGVTYEYSNLGFALLGLIINKVAGIPYQEYITTNILQPLGMEDVAWEFTKVPVQQLAHGYQWDKDHWQEHTLLHDGSFGAMGGMITSVESFARYIALHQTAWPPRDDVETGPIKRASLREMHQPWRYYAYNAHSKLDVQVCATIMAYGYGLRWLHDCHEREYIGHSGGLPGFGSNWVFLPDYGIGVVLLANTTYATAEAINLKVINTLIIKGHLKPWQLPPSAILQQKKDELLKYLPNWQNAQESGLFAANFFLDFSVDSLKKETQELFIKAGKIADIGAIIPENQLRGYFIMKGENADLKISFTLSPENPALIQSYHIQEIEHGPAEIYMA